VALTESGVIDTTLRWPDEFVRHKAGDIVGDLVLAGGRIQAHIVAHRPSHKGNVALARALVRNAKRTGVTLENLFATLADRDTVWYFERS
jgi:UDP-3-O-[3-hydroxymyristoyl] N-acetylglucosamine deacetylase/3-hydroxyacyl-[acyl-carrier-protein] dehydratase